jgi:hypothetical protein
MTISFYYIIMKEELKRRDAPSSIVIYMLENGAGEQESRMAIRDLTTEIWKWPIGMRLATVSTILTLKGMRQHSAHLPLHFTKALMELVPHTYQDIDGISASDDKKRMEIKELFLEPRE